MPSCARSTRSSPVDVYKRQAYTRDQLKAWVDYAKKNDAIILYDAAYECFISDENQMCIRDRTPLV